MFVVDLAALRNGEVQLRKEVRPGDPVLAGAEEYDAPVDIEINARQAGESVWVTARARTTLALHCRRCLEPVRREIDARFDLVYQEDPDEADGEIYPLDAHRTELDLSDAIREHLILRVPKFVSCSDSCRGLCPQCGMNLNTGECACEPELGGSPWDALKDIRFD